MIVAYKGGGVKMEEQEPKQETTQVKKEEHTRITLPAFFYTLTVISIISLICLIYVLHLRNQDTEERLNRLENSIQTVQTTETDNTNI